MADEILFQDGSVTVTSTMLSIGATMYPIRNITSVSSATIAPVISGYVGLLVLLVPVLLMGVINLPNTGVSGILGVSVFAALFAIIARVIRRARNTFVLRISTSGGQVDALKSIDEADITRVAKAVMDAIARLR